MEHLPSDSGVKPVVEGATKEGTIRFCHGDLMLSAEAPRSSAASVSSLSYSSWHGVEDGRISDVSNCMDAITYNGRSVAASDDGAGCPWHSVVVATITAAVAAVVVDVSGVPRVGNMRRTTPFPWAAVSSMTMPCRRRRLVVRRRMAVLAMAGFGAFFSDWETDFIPWPISSSAATSDVSNRLNWKLITAISVCVTVVFFTMLIGCRAHAMGAFPATLRSQHSSSLPSWLSPFGWAMRTRESNAIPAHRAVLGWPTTLGLIVLYVFCDIGVLVSTRFATEAYVRESAQFCSSLTAWAMVLAVTGRWSGIEDVKRALVLGSWKPLVVACLFSLAIWAQMKALALIPVFFAKLLFQLKLPCTVFFSTMILRRGYSLLQLQALGNISLAVITFTCLRNERCSIGSTDQTIECSHVINARSGKGLLFCGLAVCFSSLGTVLCEKAFLDGEGRISWWTTVAYLKAGESVVAFALLSIVPNAPLPLGELVRRPLLLFKGFDQSVWMVVVFLLSDAWMNVLLVKTLSSVSKSISKCLSLIVLYLLSVLILREEEFWLPTLLLAFVVGNGIGLFANASSSAQRGLSQRNSF
eukprot:TRINITY_DN5723_c0_g1_i1.p1 TRINITY_DN5723_c0_g1~~TRINITY_DN5723_c0_g1_i1.p1  ORF type:complete len:583 (-),score=61.25 TRINITY_DN5723_c0_g1_i1:78-1826(-)